MSSPTSNITVTTPIESMAAPKVWSMPVISRSTISSGRTTRFCTSSGLAPCIRTMTLAAGTSICGFSSRGVTASATRPIRKIRMLMIGVRFVRIAICPSRPAMFSRGSCSEALFVCMVSLIEHPPWH